MATASARRWALRGAIGVVAAAGLTAAAATMAHADSGATPGPLDSVAHVSATVVQPLAQNTSKLTDGVTSLVSPKKSGPVEHQAAKAPKTSAPGHEGTGPATPPVLRHLLEPVRSNVLETVPKQVVVPLRHSVRPVRHRVAPAAQPVVEPVVKPLATPVLTLARPVLEPLDRSVPTTVRRSVLEPVNTGVEPVRNSVLAPVVTPVQQVLGGLTGAPLLPVPTLPNLLPRLPEALHQLNPDKPRTIGIPGPGLPDGPPALHQPSVPEVIPGAAIEPSEELSGTAQVGAHGVLVAARLTAPTLAMSGAIDARADRPAPPRPAPGQAPADTPWTPAGPASAPLAPRGPVTGSAGDAPVWADQPGGLFVCLPGGWRTASDRGAPAPRDRAGMPLVTPD